MEETFTLEDRTYTVGKMNCTEGLRYTLQVLSLMRDIKADNTYDLLLHKDSAAVSKLLDRAFSLTSYEGHRLGDLTFFEKHFKEYPKDMITVGYAAISKLIDPFV